jgi:serine protease AprX
MMSLSRRFALGAGAAALTVLAIFTALAQPAGGSSKLDRAVADWSTGRREDAARVLVQTRQGTGEAVISRLRASADWVRPSSAPDLLVARLSREALATAVRDRDVWRVSSDAPVEGFAKSSTSTTSSDFIEATDAMLTSWAAAASLDSNTLLSTLGLVGQNGKRSSSFTGTNVKVAVIDSGIDRNFLDVGDVVLYDFTKGGVQALPSDEYGHGTHVAGLVASRAIMSGGSYQGVAPGARLFALKVLDATGRGYTSDVIAAIDFVVASRKTLGIGVMNLSLGHPIYEPAASDPLVQAVERAVASGIVVVVSAGNFGGDPATRAPRYAGITSPGNAPSAITVGAVDTIQTASRGDDVVAWFSSRGPTWYDGYQKPDLVAPGSRLVSNISVNSTLYKAYPGGIVTTASFMPYFRMSGTSMAAPVVTGIVASMLEASIVNGKALTPNAIKAILQYTAIPVTGADDLSQGAGMVNGNGAITVAASIDPTAKRGTWWLAVGVNEFTTIAEATHAWGQRVIWGDRVVWGDHVYRNDPAWAMRVIWGDRVVWGDRVIWGDSTVWGAPQAVWSARVIWGDSLLGVDGSRVVWGDLKTLSIAPTTVSWGQIERANMDIAAQ